MDFIRSKKGEDLLLYQGYTLSKRKVLAAGETVWECTKRRNEHPCDVTVKSLNGVIVPPVMPGDHDHLHAPDLDAIEVLRARPTMKRRAQDTATETSYPCDNKYLLVLVLPIADSTTGHRNAQRG